MIIIKYDGYEETLPSPPTALQLLTAIRIGVRRMRERHDRFALPRAFAVYLNEQPVDPKDSECIILDGSTIELRQVDPSDSVDVTLFELDL